MAYVILNFLIYRPLRNDLAGVRLMTPTMFKKLKERYLIGMSVPPVMTAQIATEIYNQWISKL